MFESKNAFESVGKSLIRWIDRSIFDLFVVGLKKTKMIFEAESAGISLVLPSAPSNPLGESKEGEADVNDPKAPNVQNAHQVSNYCCFISTKEMKNYQNITSNKKEVNQTIKTLALTI